MRTSRSPDDAEAQAERIAALLFMACRGSQLAFSALMLANDRRRYDRPLLQAAALTGIVAESGWLSRRIIRARGYGDRLGVWVDCVSAAAALLISQRGLGTRGAAPWAKNLAIGAALGAASTRRTTDTVGTVGTLCAAAIATGLRARGRDAHVAGLALAVNDAVSWAGSHVAARSYLNAHRRYARLRDEADALTVERAAAAASEAERSGQRELLHRVTVGVLDAIASSAELGPAEAAARGEAARLRYALSTGGRVPRGLDRGLTEIAEAATAGIGEADSGPARDPLQACPQQRLPGRDAHRRGFVHQASLALARRSRVVRTTPFSELPAAQGRLADRPWPSSCLATRTLITPTARPGSTGRPGRLRRM